VLAVAQKAQGLIAQIKARADVRLVTVIEENRDGLPEERERWALDRTNRFPKKSAEFVNLPSGAFVYKMSAAETPSNEAEILASGGRRRGHDGTHSRKLLG
jgi:hypothetical protein